MHVTKLFFRYSPIYDRTIASLVNQPLSENDIAEGFRFTNIYTDYWKKKNDVIFSYYQRIGLLLPSFWLAYPIHAQPHTSLIPFNDPLTFFITENLQQATATVIHEVVHVFFGYFENAKRADELWLPITKTFAQESFDIQEHVLVNVLAAGGYFTVLKEQEVAACIERERRYPTLKRSWEIIDSHISSFLDLKQPLEVLKKLSSGK